jgi:hypothetical protein
MTISKPGHVLCKSGHLHGSSFAAAACEPEPEFPRRWTGPNFKTGKTSRVAKRQDKAKQAIAVKKKKADVRRRDRKCRFPICGCAKLKIQPHVSHSKHAGMGGNPAGDRSAPELMIYVCACRHRENRISIDKGDASLE